ncbi:MAG TPA: hypothetical protein VGS03_02325 [Candidatus Polarisedimenticolia bacterium]|jgi:hypothetical protein|nr:hypothetical protein [Candidatus Polarisedimenticolia bacterium]
MTNRALKEVWIGLIEVVPLPGVDTLGTVSGAFVNFLALAADESEYREQVQAATSEAGFQAMTVEDVEPLRLRLSRANVDAELMSLAEGIEARGGFKFGTFHTFTQIH